MQDIIKMERMEDIIDSIDVLLDYTVSKSVDHVEKMKRNRNQSNSTKLVIIPSVEDIY